MFYFTCDRSFRQRARVALLPLAFGEIITGQSKIEEKWNSTLLYFPLRLPCPTPPSYSLTLPFPSLPFPIPLEVCPLSADKGSREAP